MSLTFVQPQQKKGPAPNQATIQKMLDENNQLIQAIVDYQNKGKSSECLQFQQMLHRNLVYLATLADSSQNIQALLPPPGQLNPGMNQQPQQQPPNSQMNQMRPPGPMQNQMNSAGGPGSGNQMMTPSSGGNMTPPTSQGMYPQGSGGSGPPQQAMSGSGGYPRPQQQMGQQPMVSQSGSYRHSDKKIVPLDKPHRHSTQKDTHSDVNKHGLPKIDQMPSGMSNTQNYNMQQQGGYPNQQQPMMSQNQPMMPQQQSMMSQQQPMMSQQQPMMSQNQPMMSQQQSMISGQSTGQSGSMMNPRQMQGGYRRPGSGQYGQQQNFSGQQQYPNQNSYNQGSQGQQNMPQQGQAYNQNSNMPQSQYPGFQGQNPQQRFNPYMRNQGNIPGNQMSGGPMVSQGQSSGPMPATMQGQNHMGGGQMHGQSNLAGQMPQGQGQTPNQMPNQISGQNTMPSSGPMGGQMQNQGPMPSQGSMGNQMQGPSPMSGSMPSQGQISGPIQGPGPAGGQMQSQGSFGYNSPQY
ncbi:calcium-responsive transactivator-like isoform X1 [Pecten maximus]|uniref:calcium-responsive transactivator-like isoform X1 n=1 Tax=Pecten maximus TaxID=6579 RepID=UPI001458A718|nr:calcium-responsive transactivator-like isoform X1 [Pecten maximus]